MANTQLAQRVWEIFARPTPPQRREFRDNIQNIPEEARIEIFSSFDERHLNRVKMFVDKWNAIVLPRASDEEKLLNAVLDDYDSLRSKENPDLLYFALEVFLTHYSGNISFEIPSIMVREPGLTAPTGKKDISKLEEISMEVAKGSADETKLDWFREDPLLNEHHAHWHVVYFTRNVYDRQGEMFLYMHQQMLARYDAERLSVNVPRVVAFSDMSKPIAVGYTAGPDERMSIDYDRDREVNVRVEAGNAQLQMQARTAIIEDIDNGIYDPKATTTDLLKQETDAINTLGSTLEANANPQRLNTPYQAYHAAGHNWIGALNNGVMFNTVVAIRDVVFWEWHKEVDAHYERLQQRFDPYDFKKDAPPITLRNGSDENGQPDSMDIIICHSSAIPGFDQSNFDGFALGNSAFGNDNWDKDFGIGSATFTDANGQTQTIETTNTLVTNINFGRVKYELDGQQKEYDFEYINHEPFCYFIRVQNNSPLQKQVTVRIFLVPDSHKEHRNMWIEMDKFLYELMPNSKTVIFRSDTESSVIRKPAQKDPSNYAVTFNPVADPISFEDSKCKCGWPYHLLVPKGTDSDTGAAYKLVVMMSDGEKDAIQREEGCGSLSFCAARNDKYPDKRPLGYPFNRKFKGTIMNTVTTHPNFACKSIYIQHVPV